MTSPRIAAKNPLLVPGAEVPQSPVSAPDAEEKNTADLHAPLATLPLRRIRLPFGSILPFIPPTMGTVPAGAPSAAAPANEWLKALRGIGDQIERMDADFHNLPVNRGSGLCRFPESTPRGTRPEQCSLSVVPGTQAHAHAEIRPVGDGTESLITRVMWDFKPNVVYLQSKAYVPDLEIDGASSVDPPSMGYDRSFSDTKTIIHSVGNDGDLEYENPMGSGEAWATPFDSTAPLPPHGHRYWMFRFQPAVKNLISGVEVFFAEGGKPKVKAGLGGLYLWGFLLGLGVDQDADFSAYGIPYNTMPRRLGDLLDMMRFLGDPQQRAARLENASLINPNTEYIDFDGARRKIPEDANEVKAINAKRAALKLPPLGRNRGPIIDWVFTDLAKDPRRLGETKDSELPSAEAHLQFREGFLDLPIGRIHVDADTDIKLKYYLGKAETADPSLPRGKLGLQIEISNFRLEGTLSQILGVDLKVGTAVLQAQSLVAKRAIVDIPDIIALGNAAHPDAVDTASFRLEGVNIQGFQAVLEKPAVELKVPSASLSSLTFKKLGPSWETEMEGLALESLQLRSQDPNAPVQEIEIPATSIPESVLKGRLTPLGKMERLSLDIPELPSNVLVKLGLGPAQNIEAQLKTTGVLKNIHYALEIKNEKALHKMDVSFPSLELVADGAVPHTPLQSSVKLAVTQGGFSVDEMGSHLEGDLDLKVSGATALVGFGRGQTQWGNLVFAEGSPRIRNVSGEGHFRFDQLKDGWRLSNPKHDTRPLNFEFDVGFEFSNKPKLKDSPPGSDIIKTEIRLDQGKALVRDLREIGFRQDATSGAGTAFEAGAVFLSGLQGSGKIWQNLPIWGDVRLNLPSFGKVDGKASAVKRSASIPLPPDATPLARRIPASVLEKLKQDMPGLSEDDILKQLAQDNFFLLSDIAFHGDPKGWKAHLGDLVANLHEQPKTGTPFRGSFGMVRIPQIDVEASGETFSFSIDFKNIFNYIFMNEPDRGGNICIVKWIEPLAKQNLCSSHK